MAINGIKESRLTVFCILHILIEVKLKELKITKIILKRTGVLNVLEERTNLQ